VKETNQSKKRVPSNYIYHVACEKCCRRFGDESKLDAHKQFCDGEKREFPCLECLAVCKTAKNLAIHRKVSDLALNFDHFHILFGTIEVLMEPLPLLNALICNNTYFSSHSFSAIARA